MSDATRIALIRKMDAAGVYSDAWTCPECGRGDMTSEDAAEGYEACEIGDRVQCDECAHVCVLEDMLFVRGDISTLLEALDEATKPPEPETFPKDWRKCAEFVACLEARGYLLPGDGTPRVWVMDESDEMVSAGICLCLYELWQDGRRG